ncbi:unnamed protein product [Darwinula stevensoni]|uniref:G-protein coupled receptors family 1 profile domain-containing protein n=1 Tax=Darwinula stevensoni TaxID=69355 RepID=A0A7R9A9R5_9CRUS|nr:unnamed protein product [Darwinula stevensoni]CAG0897449.1 unnamed protein product [Darwinula stevensoni]
MITGPCRFGRLRPRMNRDPQLWADLPLALRRRNCRSNDSNWIVLMDIDGSEPERKGQRRVVGTWGHVALVVTKATIEFSLVSLDCLSATAIQERKEPNRRIPRDGTRLLRRLLAAPVPFARLCHLLAGTSVFDGERHRCLRKTATVLVLNLAAADLGNSLMHSMATVSSFSHGWQFGNSGCKFYAGMVGLFGLVSIMTLSAIAVERCLVIASSAKFSKPTPELAKRVCVGIWFYCLVLVIPPYLGWSDYVPEAFLTSCTWDFYTRTLSNRAYYLFLLLFGFVVPVSIIFWAYISIICTFRHVKDMGETSEKRNENKREARKRTEFWVAKIVFVLIVLFLVSWTPYTIVSFIAIFGDIDLITPWVSAAPVVFAKASVVYNPIVYGISHPAFRFNLKRTIIKILSANMSEEGKEVFPPSSSDASRLRNNAGRLPGDSVNTGRILTRFRDYHREAESVGNDSIASCPAEDRSVDHGRNRAPNEKTVRFKTPERKQIPDGSLKKKERKSSRAKKDSLTDESNYITLNCKENGETVIRISNSKVSSRKDSTSGVLDSNQLVQLLLTALQKKGHPPSENEYGVPVFKPKGLSHSQQHRVRTVTLVGPPTVTLKGSPPVTLRARVICLSALIRSPTFGYLKFSGC